MSQKPIANSRFMGLFFDVDAASFGVASEFGGVVGLYFGEASAEITGMFYFKFKLKLEATFG
jgi:hypothetical protein